MPYIKTMKKSTPKNTTTHKIDDAQLVKAALVLLQQSPQALRWTALARALRITLAQLRMLVADEGQLLQKILAQFDQAMLQANLDGASKREKLFELLMARADAMQPHKLALRHMWRRLRPQTAPALVISFSRTLEWLGAASGLDNRPLPQHLALAYVYGRMLKAFWVDEGADMAKTMAALDKSLEQIESWGLLR